ncbi:TipJ family phage tail tip protein, partial [Glaesserella parasuis]
EREVSVGAEVKLEHPISRTVIDPDIDLLRITLGVNALFSQNDLETSRLEQCTISFSVGREGLQVRAKPSIFLMNQRQDYTSPTLNNY